MRVVEVVPHNPEWHHHFEREAALLKSIFESQIVTIHHIGSTSVSGLHAKPIIDLLPEVYDISRVDNFNDAMVNLGYDVLGEYGLAGRRYFRKLSGTRHLTHIHTYQTRNPEIDRYLAFRDYLRANENAADEYGELKLALAKRHRHDFGAYQDEKDIWVEKVEKRAMAWRKMSAKSKEKL